MQSGTVLAAPSGVQPFLREGSIRRVRFLGRRLRWPEAVRALRLELHAPKGGAADDWYCEYVAVRLVHEPFAVGARACELHEMEAELDAPPWYSAVDAAGCAPL